jgi:hypothetical protein
MFMGFADVAEAPGPGGAAAPAAGPEAGKTGSGLWGRFAGSVGAGPATKPTREAR